MIMDSKNKERRRYIRSAVVCFVCTAVCIGIDVRNFIYAGHIYFNWNIGFSIVMYIVLILCGIWALKKAKDKNNE
jgi:hypothetical protein